MKHVYTRKNKLFYYIIIIVVDPCSTKTTLKGCITAFWGLSFDFITFTVSMVPLSNSYIKLQSLVFNNKRPIKYSCQALLGMSNHPSINFE